MTADLLLSVLPRLDQFLTQFNSFMGRRENRRHLEVYCRGRLGPIERKSLEPIALAEGLPARPLQLFFDRSLWEEEAVLDHHQALVAQHFGEEEGIFVADATSDAKKGTETAGVASQYCGETGKIDNCIVSVHWAYVGHEDTGVLLDGNLYLPPAWDPEQCREEEREEAQRRRKKTGIPEKEKSLSHAQMSILQLRRILENGVPGRWATGDCAFGRSWEWRQSVDEMGLLYVVQVPHHLRGHREEPRFAVPPKQGDPRGRKPQRRRPETESLSPKEVLAGGHHPPFELWHVRDGEKGPDVWEVARLPYWMGGAVRGEQTQAGTLLIVRNAISPEEEKYYFSNAPRETPTADLLRVAASRWRIERCFQDAKGELGLGHAEARSWISLRRHLVLTCVLHLFLVLVRRDWGEKDGRINAEPSGRRDRGSPRCAQPGSARRNAAPDRGPARGPATRNRPQK